MLLKSSSKLCCDTVLITPCLDSRTLPVRLRKLWPSSNSQTSSNLIWSLRWLAISSRRATITCQFCHKNVTVWAETRRVVMSFSVNLLSTCVSYWRFLSSSACFTWGCSWVLTLIQISQRQRSMKWAPMRVLAYLLIQTTTMEIPMPMGWITLIRLPSPGMIIALWCTLHQISTY